MYINILTYIHCVYSCSNW